jgi:hypothetical protein
MVSKLSDVYLTVNTDKNVFYSAYLKGKIQYNDVDPDKIKLLELVEFSDIESHEEPVAQVIEEPVLQVIEEPVAQVIEELVSQVIEEPVSQVIEEPVSQVIEEPVSQVIEEPVITNEST